MTATLAEIDTDALLDETIELLREYLRFDTTNPPGDVSQTADWVESVLGSAGLETTRLASTPDKANVVATIPGPLSPLVLSHHMDVVGAPPDGWSVDPFSGELRDGFVYGRGALDMKGYGAMTLACALALVRARVPLRRALRIVVTADEEVGGALGARWLADTHPDAISGEFMLTEGSFGRTTRRGTWYLVEVAQKGVSTIKLIARGEPGHASAPTEDNVVVRMARALARLGSYRSPPTGLDLARRFLGAFPPSFIRNDSGRPLAELDDAEVEELIQKLSASRRRSTMLRNTFTPTMVQAGVGQNVIPGLCEAYVDCRSLPGVNADDVMAEVASAVDDPDISLELVKSSEGSESSPDTELYRALSEAVVAERPDALVIPFMGSGGTDAKHFRPLGVACYGLIPFELDDGEASRIHGIDERVSVENLDRGLRILLGAIARLCVGS